MAKWRRIQSYMEQHRAILEILAKHYKDIEQVHTRQKCPHFDDIMTNQQEHELKHKRNESDESDESADE